MKVKELLTALNKCDPDANVIIFGVSEFTTEAKGIQIKNIYHEFGESIVQIYATEKEGIEVK